jgi:hypothetical protein
MVKQLDIARSVLGITRSMCWLSTPEACPFVFYLFYHVFRPFPPPSLFSATIENVVQWRHIFKETIIIY